MIDFDGLGGFDEELGQLTGSVEEARVVTQSFTHEIDRVKLSLASVNTDVATFEKGLSKGLKRAFDGVVFKGLELSDAMRVLGESLSRTVYKAALDPVADGFASSIASGLGGLFGASPFGEGAAFSSGRVTPFARGGIVSQATAFPMRGGVGLMGEAGPEAIMPLARGSDGRLGVRSAGGGTPANVTINVTTPDVAGFQKSRGQIAAQVNRALARGQRNA
ncbi:MAG: phage tail tape measure protein [Pseudomonadota bacterium]